MEKKLFEDGIISIGDINVTSTTDDQTLHTPPNKSLIQLEATLLDLAATPDLCQGVLYMFPVKLGSKYIIRYLKYFILLPYLSLNEKMFHFSELPQTIPSNQGIKTIPHYIYK